MTLSNSKVVEYFKSACSSILEDLIREFDGVVTYKVLENGQFALSQIYIRSDTFFKLIEIRLAIGVDESGRPNDGLDFFVECICEKVPNGNFRKTFTLKDYCTHIGVPLNIPSDCSIAKKIESYLNLIKKVYSEDGLKEVLITKIWTSMPIDWSPYK